MPSSLESLVACPGSLGYAPNPSAFEVKTREVFAELGPTSPLSSSGHLDVRLGGYSSLGSGWTLGADVEVKRQGHHKGVPMAQIHSSPRGRPGMGKVRHSAAPSSLLQERLSPQHQEERQRRGCREGQWKRPLRACWAGLCVLRGRTSLTGRWDPSAGSVVPCSSLLMNGVLAGKLIF